MKKLKTFENFPGSGLPDDYQSRTGDMSGEYKNMYSDKGHDYSKTNEPITLDVIKSYIMEELNNMEVDNPSLESDVDMLAKRIMFSFLDKLNHISENYEVDLENISNGSFE